MNDLSIFLKPTIKYTFPLCNNKKLSPDIMQCPVIANIQICVLPKRYTNDSRQHGHGNYKLSHP